MLTVLRIKGQASSWQQLEGARRDRGRLLGICSQHRGPGPVILRHDLRPERVVGDDL